MASPLVALAPRIAFVPVVRGSAAFANEVRRAMLEWRPDVVAVELPRALAAPLGTLVAALPRVEVLAWTPPGSPEVLFLAPDPCDPRIEALRLGREHGLDVHLIDVVEAGLEETWAALPDDAAVGRIGAAAFAQAWRKAAPATPPTPRQRILAARIAHLAAGERRVLVVAGFTHLHAFAELLADLTTLADVEDNDPAHVTSIIRPAPESWMPHLLSEIPALTELYEEFREEADIESTFPVATALTRFLESAAERYDEEFDEQVNLTEWRALYQFGRNLSLVRGLLMPSLYELVMAAKACVDDDFGQLVLERALAYTPNQPPDDDIFASEDDPFGLEEEAAESKRRSPHLYFDLGDGLRLGRPAYPRPEMTTIEFRFRRRRPDFRELAEWREEFASQFGLGACSWPPEDERIEKFFAFLRKRALEQVSAEHTRVEEFVSSMHDGLDFRETMRNWHTGKLFVRRERQPPGRVGPVVLVWHDAFPEDPEVWKTTLYAEHQNESDICFYGTHPGVDMVGPSISRTEYFGVLSIFPACHMPDLWGLLPMYRWDTCARILLAGAILLSREKYVAWVAPQPPDRDLIEFARSRGVAIITLPLSSFSRKTLKRLRQAHLLGSKQARGWAGDYIND